MKAKKVITGAVAGLSFLALAATGALAVNDVCNSGTVTATGAGHVYAGTTAITTTTMKTNLRSVTLTCETAVGSWNGTATRTFVIPATPDKDGIYAAALTALADGKKVKFVLSTPDVPAPGLANASKGLVRLLHVTNVDL